MQGAREDRGLAIDRRPDVGGGWSFAGRFRASKPAHVGDHMAKEKASDQGVQLAGVST